MNSLNKNFLIFLDNLKPRERVHPAIIGMWSSIIALAHLIPAMPLIGTGSTFAISIALFPLSGVFFGPFYGFLCAAVGGFIGQILAPNVAWLGIFTFMVGSINALAAGLVSRGYWYINLLILGIFTGLWFTTEIGRNAVIFPAVFYGLGAIVMIVGGINFKKLFNGNLKCKSIAIFITSFAGMVTAASFANYFSILLFGTPAEVWNVIAFLSPVERAAFSVISSIIGTPLIIAINHTRFSNR